MASAVFLTPNMWDLKPLFVLIKSYTNLFINNFESQKMRLNDTFQITFFLALTIQDDLS